MINDEMKYVLITGSNGMVGSNVVDTMLANNIPVVGIDIKISQVNNPLYMHEVVDLTSAEDVDAVFEKYDIFRVIHLAALAHTANESDLSYERYYNVNVVCSQNIFEACAKRNIPILFISTADVYGFTKGIATPDKQPRPVSIYAKTKYIAEVELAQICAKHDSEYDIYRFAPVYTDTIKRDIQKRYYIKYPKVAYIVGKGTDYEFLNIKTAADKLLRWVLSEPQKRIHNIKDEQLVNTAECLKSEREQGRARFVLHIPRWVVAAGFSAILAVTGKNKYTYLINKAVNPLRTQ